jgi:hypothetical protein
MQLRLSPKFALTFIALIFVMHEAHEIVHTAVGRLICGCWGIRDFNVWELCEGCLDQHPMAILSTFAGPLFTFAMIWIGYALLASQRSNEQRALGFSLIFANMPIARIITAAMGGGDEAWGVNHLTGNFELSRVIGLTAILLLSVPPMVRAFRSIANAKRIGWFLLFLLAPMFIDLLLVLGVMNTLLEQGILADYWILGSPMLVTLWTAAVTVVYSATRKNIHALVTG